MTIPSRRMTAPLSLRRLAAALALLCASATLASAQQTASIGPDPAKAREEYERIVHEITVSDERAAQLAAEIATLRKDDATRAMSLKCRVRLLSSGCAWTTRQRIRGDHAPPVRASPSVAGL